MDSSGFLAFPKKIRKRENKMKYLIDHDSKFIHEIQYATDRCQAGSASDASKEYTDSPSHISQLEKDGAYMKCPYCHEVPLLMD